MSETNRDQSLNYPTERMQPVPVLVGAGIIFLAALYELHDLAGGHGPPVLRDSPWSTPLLAAFTALLGIYLVRSVVTVMAVRSMAYLGAARVRGARMIASVVLYIVLAIAVASQTRVDLSGIALSGAVTGVIVGIAAQTSIANVIGGLVILFVRPFRTGQYVTVRAAAFAGSEYSGEVAEITLFYTTLYAGVQEIRVPNSSMVTSVVTLRPQVLDVYLPIVVPPARWERFTTAGLTRELTAALPPGRLVTAVVERMDGAAVQVGIHASVANADERSTLERALLRALDHAPDDDSLGPHAGDQ